jgi:hypothetical protein
MDLFYSNLRKIQEPAAENLFYITVEKSYHK